MIDDSTLATWVHENLEGSEFKIKKDRVCMISCGTKTYTWLINAGTGFTVSQSADGNEELANTIWVPNNIIHSFDEDIMLPMHALTDCSLVRYSSEEFNAAVSSNAELAWALAEHYHNQFTETLSRYKRMALVPSEDRLLEIESALKSIPELKSVKISDAILSLFMGMHRVSVSRLRKKLGEAPSPSL